MEILSHLNRQLNAVLVQSLPQIDPDWWQSLVLEKLTFQQKTFAENLPLNALDQLDLSALLRQLVAVFYRNWTRARASLQKN